MDPETRGYVRACFDSIGAALIQEHSTGRLSSESFDRLRDAVRVERTNATSAMLDAVRDAAVSRMP